MDIKYFLLPDNEPIFFADSFKLPLFNNVMEQELINALNWLKQQKLDDDLISCISRITTEIIDINKRLLNKVDFNSDINYDCAEYYALINPKIKISCLSYVCTKQCISVQTRECLLLCMREISRRNVSNDISKENMYRFFFYFLRGLYTNVRSN